MKKHIVNFVLFNFAIIFYFIGWITKNTFYLSFSFIFLSLILFFYLWQKTDYLSSVNYFENKKENVFIFVIKILIILFSIWLGFEFFKYKKDLLANIAFLCGLLQISLLFRGTSPQFVEINKEELLLKNELDKEKKQKIFIKSLLVIFFVILFIFIIFLSYKTNKYGIVFVSSLILLIGITGFGYFYSIIEREKFLENKKNFFDKLWFNLTTLILFLIIALFLRIFQIGNIPDGYSLDEQLIGAYAGPVMQNQRIDVFIADARFQVASLYYYLVGQLWKFIPTSIDNARIVSAVVGVLNIIFIYLMTLEMFKNKRIALLSAFFMTFSYYHIIYSRIAWLWIFVPTLATATFYFYLLGERTGKFVYYMIAGVIMGINLYFYNAAKMVPFIFVFYWIFLLLNNTEQRNYISNNKRALTVFIISSLIVFIPLAIYIIKYPDAYFDRIRGESIFRGKNFLNILSPDFLTFFFTHAKDTVLMYIYKASRYGYYNYPFKPLLDNISGFLYILGFSYTIYNFRRSKHFLLLLLFLFSLVPAFFSVHSSDPNTQRAILSIVPLILFMSLGAEVIFKTIEFFKIRVVKLLCASIFIIFAPFIIFDNLHTYFNLYKNNDNVKAEFFYVPSKVIKWVNNSYKYYNYGSFFYLETPNFHVNKGINFKFFDFAAMRFYEWKGGGQGQGIQFIIEGIYNKTADIVKEYIPDAVIKRHWDSYSDITNKKYFYRVFDEFNPKLLFISIEIPENSLKMFHSLNVKYYKDKKLIGNAFINNSEIPYLNGAEEITVEGLIDIPFYSDYKFYCVGSYNYDIYIDGEKFLGVKKLPAGLHKMKIIFKMKEPQNLNILWECPEYNISGKIPYEYFINSDKIFGLKAQYFIDGEKVSEQIEPIITHRVYYMSSKIKSKKWQNKHDVLWTGKIYIPETNVTYLLDTEHDSYIEIDKQIVFKIKDKEKIINTFKGKPGWQDIKIYYSYKGLGLLTHRLTGVRFMFKTENMKMANEVPFNLLKPFTY